MKKRFFQSISCFLIVSVLTITIPFGLCNNELQAASRPSITQTSNVHTIGDSFKLTVKKSKSQIIKKAKWKSSNKKIASIKSTTKTSANIYAKKVGKAKITATISYCKKGSKKLLTIKRTCSLKITKQNNDSPSATSTPAPATPTPAPSAPTSPAPASPSPTNTNQPSISTNFMDYDSIATLASKYGFKVGTNINASSVYDSTFTQLLKQHFNSVTASNEMKAYSLLNQTASQNNASGMPVMDYSKADSMMQFAKDNGLQVRGHTLVWDAYMSNWFFKVGYDKNNGDVDTATAKARLKYYIEDVVTHFETKYPGVIYCWDVVNEAVGDSDADYDTADNRHVRKYRNKSDNVFYKEIGSDYVELSFLYTKNTLDSLGSNVKLFYNDYDTFQPDKRDAICNLVTSINSYDKDASGNYRKLCDGIGMQGYIGGYGTQEGCMNMTLLN